MDNSYVIHFVPLPALSQWPKYKRFLSRFGSPTSG
jgi:hypothetical protein